jgi:hypothetical protein
MGGLEPPTHSTNGLEETSYGIEIIQSFVMAPHPDGLRPSALSRKRER